MSRPIMKKVAALALWFLVGLVPTAALAQESSADPRRQGAGGEVTHPSPGVTRAELYKNFLTGTLQRDVTLYTYVIEPGATVPKHIHPGDEWGYVLEGAIDFEIEGKPPQTVETGGTFHMPALTRHLLRNTGSKPAKLFMSSVTERGKKSTVWLN